MVRAFANPRVYACHCEAADGSLLVGILATQEGLEPGEQRLYNLDHEERSLLILIPSLPNPAYDVELPILDG